ncbi:hypothetical protein [Roseibium sediminicola]|uniref:SMP-30/Gluconolactonase/LRE-like region domain-containing protein n=1 Tax=Roseibium sediminicola TaxID=2933272 RepID=A0ABT0GVI9_9HYPH|nr:hypothetical protein [Roseibium sp. CAU 1639]MCK7613457.1 hypothetical protein [Roseibium sp. CAU 1639]
MKSATRQGFKMVSVSRFAHWLLPAILIITPASAGEVERISLPGKHLFPESIAMDSRGGTYVSSVTRAEILYLDSETRQISGFVERGSFGLASVGGLQLGPEEKVLYACNSDLGLTEHPTESGPALLAFDVAERRLVSRWELPGGGLCNDLAIAEDGTIYVTDSFMPRILSLPPGGSELTPFLVDERFSGQGFNLSGIVILEDRLIVSKFNSGELFSVDLATRNVVPLRLDKSLQMPDGIAVVGSDTLLVAESGGRVSRVVVSSETAAVTVLADGLRAPSDVMAAGKQVFVLEGQLDRLPGFDPEGRQPEPFLVRVFEFD